MPGDLRRALRVFETASSYNSKASLEKELKWQRSTSFAEFTECDLLREGAWVILCSGFRETTVRGIFDHISLSFCDWESAGLIVEQSSLCKQAAMASFRNERKLNALCQMASLIHTKGFAPFKSEILRSPTDALLVIPYIGPITAFHLAKNLGLDVAKPDRHLVRLSNWLGFATASELCSDLADATGEQVKIIDLVLWRFMADQRLFRAQDLPA